MNTILTLLGHEQLREHYGAGNWRNDTIYDYLSKHAAQAPDRPAFRDSVRTYTYRELHGAVDRFAAELESRGVMRGQRVAVWLPSRIETAIALLACSRNGYVCCPSLHRDHTVTAVVELLDRMRAVAVIAQRGYGADAERRDFQTLLEQAPSVRHVYSLDAPGDASDGLTSLGPNGNALASTSKKDPDSVVYLAFTSGTTGEPKGVMHSDNTLLANALAIASDWHLDAGSVIYSISPLSHNLGLGAMIMTFAVGGEFVVHDLPKGASLAARVIETNATFLVGVPTHAFDLLGELERQGISKLGNVRGFRISGAPASKEVVAGLIEHGVTPQSGYGMTEAGSHHYTLPTDDARRILETSGRACRSYAVRIFDEADADRELPVGEIGQIGGRGASLMLGYFDAQYLTEQAFNKTGWFMTGDVGWIDADGYIHVTGRKKDLIIRGGHNIYPAQIENLAMRHPLVERAVAVPVPDERLGEKVGIVVMLRDGSGLTADDLLAHLDRAGLSKWDMPEYYLVVDEIPLTSSGKIRKLDIIEEIRSGALVPAPIRFSAAVPSAASPI